MNQKTILSGLRPLFVDNLHKIVDHLPTGKHGKYFLLSIMKREKLSSSILEACLESDFLVIQKKTSWDGDNQLTFYTSI